MYKLLAAFLIAIFWLSNPASAAKQQLPRCNLISAILGSPCKAAKKRQQKRDLVSVQKPSKSKKSLQREKSNKAKRAVLVSRTKVKTEKSSSSNKKTAAPKKKKDAKNTSSAKSHSKLKMKAKKNQISASRQKKKSSAPRQQSPKRQSMTAADQEALKRPDREKLLATTGCFELSAASPRLARLQGELTGALRISLNAGTQPDPKPDAWGQMLVRTKSKGEIVAATFHCVDNVSSFACAATCDGGIFTLVVGSKGLSLIPHSNLKMTGENCTKPLIAMDKAKVAGGLILAQKSKKTCETRRHNAVAGT